MSTSKLGTLLLLASTFSTSMLRNFAAIAVDEHVRDLYAQRFLSAVPASAFNYACELAVQPDVVISVAIWSWSAFCLQFWFDSALPTRTARSSIEAQDLHLVPTGERLSIRWLNIVVRWALEELLLTAVMGLIISALTGNPIPDVSHLRISNT